MIFSGGEKHTKGVGIIISKKIEKSKKGYWTVSDREILMELAAKPFDISIIQVYAPTEIESFYEQLDATMKQVKSNEILIIIGRHECENWTRGIRRHSGELGLGKRNERGDQLVEFAEKNNMCIMNTWFSQPPRKLYTWISPGDVTRIR